MKKEHIIYYLIVIALIAYVIWYYAKKEPSEKKGGVQGARDLASCLRDKGVKFYGAHYCSHCTKQKQMFGEDAAKLPYIECEGTPKNPACAQAKITGYPTWVFPNGKRLTGAVNLEQLKEEAGC